MVVCTLYRKQLIIFAIKEGGDFVYHAVKASNGATVALQHEHTDFILVPTETKDWGGEIG